MRSRLLIFTAALLLGACIPLTTPGATGNNIFVYNYFFSPVYDSTTALRNDSATVTFRWTDSSGGHSIVWDTLPDGVTVGNLPVTFTGNYPFPLAVGRYVYHCSLHGDPANPGTNFGMGGIIVIRPFDTPTSSKALPGRQGSPVVALVTPPVPGAEPGSRKRAAQRSRSATS